MKPSWSIFDCRQPVRFRLPLTDRELHKEPTKNYDRSRYRHWRHRLR
jgi:hypothetical protein